MKPLCQADLLARHGWARPRLVRPSLARPRLARPCLARPGFGFAPLGSARLGSAWGALGVSGRGRGWARPKKLLCCNLAARRTEGKACGMVRGPKWIRRIPLFSTHRKAPPAWKAPSDSTILSPMRASQAKPAPDNSQAAPD